MNYSAVNFYDTSIWGTILLVGILFVSLLFANIIKTIFFKKSLIPNSVLGGCILLLISTICFYIKGDYLFNLPIFSPSGNGISLLETITYHCLGLGFVAMTLRPSKSEKRKDQSKDVINSGLLTISTYMLQGVSGMIISFIAALTISGFAPGSGILLAFGYGQGTGQALNIGKNFDASLGVSSYANIGLSLAAMGFLVASIIGIINFNYLRKRGKIEVSDDSFEINFSEVQGENEAPNTESVDKLSIQIGFVLLTYGLCYIMMFFLGKLIPSMVGTIYGFNFIFGVVAAIIVKAVISFLKKIGWLKQDYLNVYLLNRISGFAFDLMIVAGICAIQVHLISNYIGTILCMGVVGAILTFYYVRFVCKKVFPAYKIPQFFAFFGMLTGTASTGMMLLRAADPELKTPASENLVYQNFPAIVLALPMLFVASFITNNAASFKYAIISFVICLIYFIVLNLLLFRSYIFKKKK